MTSSPAFAFALLAEADDALVAALLDGSAGLDPGGLVIWREGGRLDMDRSIDPRDPVVIAALRQVAAGLNKVAKTLEEERTIELRRKGR